MVSPGVEVKEIDLTSGVLPISTTEGGIAGLFRWGPVNLVQEVNSEADLVKKFGKPTSFNAETWFSAANFLAYANLLFVVRALGTAVSATANTGSVANLESFTIQNKNNYLSKANGFSSDTDVLYAAKYPGRSGNSLKISVCDSANSYRSTINLFAATVGNDSITSANIVTTVGSNLAVISLKGLNSDSNATLAALFANVSLTAILAQLTVGDLIDTGNSTIGKQTLKLSSISGVAVSGNIASANITFDNTLKNRATWSSNTFVRSWEYSNLVTKAPGQSQYLQSLGALGNTSANDELHIVVVDQRGTFANAPDQVLEVFSNLSRVTAAKSSDGTSIFYQGTINEGSKYVWFINERSGADSNTSANVESSTNSKPLTLAFLNGIDSTGDDESNVALGTLEDAWDKFKSDLVNVSLLIAGKPRGNTELANYIIDNVVESRKDCIVFISPKKSDVFNAFGDEVDNLITFRNLLNDTSYAVMDSGWKYQYDRYNDVNRFIPLNGDIAGLTARTDHDRDPWWSPAGLNRGIIKNSIKLAFSPNQSERDRLYQADVNPVVTFPGEGTLLFGDKTILGHSSAFDRINVRRLFIVLEKTIARAARVQLFEFNDSFTRAQFINMIEPFLRDVQGRRGITDFRVVCDETNNTPEVIDSNRFVGDIYIKPSRSINFITLSFVAVRTGVAFEEIVGRF